MMKTGCKKWVNKRKNPWAYLTRITNKSMTNNSRLHYLTVWFTNTEIFRLTSPSPEIQFVYDHL